MEEYAAESGYFTPVVDFDVHQGCVCIHAKLEHITNIHTGTYGQKLAVSSLILRIYCSAALHRETILLVTILLDDNILCKTSLSLTYELITL